MADDTVLKLVERWRGGDEQAAADLFGRYADRLLALVRQHLSKQLSRRVDADDVLQSAFRSFFSGAREGRFLFEKRNDLWPLLVAIALHKVKKQLRLHTAAKRDIAAERRPAGTDSFYGIETEVFAREPLPEEAVALADMLEQLLGSFNEEQRRMIEMRLQGCHQDEIAESLGCCRQTVLRVLRRARGQLEAWCSEFPTESP
jgi:RNA polymerase sigma-70 factor (ECF subfamily)